MKLDSISQFLNLPVGFESILFSIFEVFSGVNEMDC